MRNEKMKTKDDQWIYSNYVVMRRDKNQKTEKSIMRRFLSEFLTNLRLETILFLLNFIFFIFPARKFQSCDKFLQLKKIIPQTIFLNKLYYIASDCIAK